LTVTSIERSYVKKKVVLSLYHDVPILSRVY
jgi:hypothetical protein